MTVSITSQTQTGPATWSLTWASDQPSPTFYVYQNGLLSRTTQATAGSFRVTAGAQLLVEVLDSASQSPTFVYSGTVLLGWYQVPDTAFYRIEQYLSGAWQTLETLPDLGAWWITWVSPYLPDCATYQFRVTPLGTNGNPGNPQLFSGFMVRIPDAPAVAILLHGNNTVTISAA